MQVYKNSDMVNEIKIKQNTYRTMPKVSVIIPVFNAALYLRRCLDSVCGQTLRELEIICINDCSTDNSLDIIYEYASKDIRLKVIDFKKHKGASSARNIGLEFSKGLYLGFVDADDYIDYDFYEQLFNAAVKTNFDIIKGNFKIFEASDIKQFLEVHNRISKNKYFFLWQFTSAIYKRNFILANNIKFQEDFHVGEDLIFLISAVHATKHGICLVDTIYYNYMRANSKTDTKVLPKKRLLHAINSRQYVIKLINSLSLDIESYNIIFIDQLHNIYNLFRRVSNIKDVAKYIAKSLNKLFKEYKYKDFLNSLETSLVQNDKLHLLDIKSLTKKLIIDTYISIYISSDDNYAPYITTTIISTCLNTSKNVRFTVLDSGISKENKKYIKSLAEIYANCVIEFIKIKEEALAQIEYRNDNSHISKATYNRILIPTLDPLTDKAIYLDVDTIVMGDIKELYEVDLSGYIVGAVHELHINPVVFEKINKTLNFSSNHKYFNAGVLLIDCKKWREDNICSKLFALEKKYRKILNYADQDILNKNFDNDYKQLNVRYNTSQDTVQYLTHDIVIRHYSGYKPWDTDCISGPNNNITDFWHYAKLSPLYDTILSNFKKNNKKIKNIPNKQVLLYLREFHQRKISNHNHNISKKEICELIKAADVISFDIFDTSLIRPFIAPTDLFAFIEKQIIHELGFFSARIEAEKAAREKLKFSSKSEEITIHDIYNNINNRYKKYKNVEIALEEQILKQNLKIYSLYKLAVDLDKVVIFVSDQYLPQKSIEKALKANNYVNYYRLYLSSTIGVTKLSGNLFRYIIKDLGVSPDKILHIGDNLETDYMSPSKYGISAYHIPKPSDIFFEIPENKRLLKLLTKVEKSEASLIVGMIILKWTQGEQNNFWEKIGYILGGPLAYCFTKKIMEIAKIRKFSDIIYVARDGYILFWIYNILNSACGEKKFAKSHYLHANRRICYQCFTDYIDEVQLRYILQEYFQNRNFAELTCNELRNIYDENINKIEKKAYNFRNKFKDYFYSFELGNNIAIVDSTTKYNSAHKLVSSFLPKYKETTGIYIRTNCTNYQYNSISLINDLSKEMFNWDIIELLLSSPESMVTDFRDSKPIFDSNSVRYEEADRLKIYNYIYNGETNYIYDLINIFKYNIPVIEMTSIYSLFYVFLADLSEDESRYLSNIQHTQDNITYKSIITK
jgi:lipopolysaccharide biosynthesis glycosyltransferase/glycosyltransferase involved in cell wall biosynthesis